MNGTRDTIIETAFLLFLKKGFKAVTLTDLEKAVGMTKGTFYYHFLNKEEVSATGHGYFPYSAGRMMSGRSTAI